MYKYQLTTNDGTILMESNLQSDCLMIYYAIKTVCNEQNDSSFYMITIHDNDLELDTHVYDLAEMKVVLEPKK